MSDIYQQIILVVYGIWRKRLWALAVAWLVSIAGWVVVAQIPNLYDSSARIHVDAETMLKPLMSGLAVSDNIYEQVAMMRQTLVSRPNIEKVIRMTDLDLSIKDDAEMEALIEEVREDVNINIQAANLFKISYTNKDPAIAKKVVSSFLNIFIEDKLHDSRKDLSSALRFIEEQIREYEEQLELAEQRKAEFSHRNMAFLGNKGSYYDKLTQSKQAVEIVRRKIGEYAEQVKQLKGYQAEVPAFLPSLSSMGPSLGGGPVSGGSKVTVLRNRISMLEGHRDELFIRGYKEQHPDVRIVTDQIVELEVKLEKAKLEFDKVLEEGDPDVLSKTAGVRPNPIYDDLSTRLIDVEGEVAKLRARLRQKETDVAKLVGMAQRVPEVETELTRLNRDYDVIKDNYNKLLSKRESARMSQSLETKSDRIQFRVIEPPQAPREPSSPNRLLFVVAVLFVGLGAGVGVAFLLSQLRSTFSTEQHLRDVFSVPVLGSISVISSPVDMQYRKRSLILFSIMLTGLFISCASVFLVMDYYYSTAV